MMPILRVDSSLSMFLEDSATHLIFLTKLNGEKGEAKNGCFILISSIIALKCMLLQRLFPIYFWDLNEYSFNSMCFSDHSQNTGNAGNV